MSSEPARPSSGSIAFVLDGSSVDAGLIGGKGAALDELLSWGLPVPPSGSVTTAAHRIVMADPRVRAIVTRIREGTDTPAEAVDEAFLSVELDEAVAASVVSVAAAVGAGAKIAVRSSATVEDLAGSSFAGQYRTFLDVDPSDGDAVLDAVRLVLASLWHPAPCVYRRALGVDDEDAAMSVLFVQMVPAVTAGVVFTVDPLGGRGAARVEAVEGLGESLVSGRRTPRAWTVDRDAPGDDVPQPIREALRLALSAEEHADAPQDVEWVWDGSQVWLVQSRPITVAPSSGDGFDDELEDEDMTVAGIAEMLPGVLPPLRWEVDAHLVEEAFRCVSEDLGVATPSGERGRHMLRRVRGRAALDFGRLRMVAEAIPGAGADELEKQYFGSRRSGRPATEPPSASTPPRPAATRSACDRGDAA